MGEVFDLRWNDFSSNASRVFTSHRERSSFSDVTLVSDDLKPHSAHKIILSACSEYFSNILSAYSSPNTLVCLPGLSGEELSEMLDYVYKGEAQVQKDGIDRFLANAKKFKLEGLLPKSDDQPKPEEQKAVTVDEEVEEDCDVSEDTDDIEEVNIESEREKNDEESVLKEVFSVIDFSESKDENVLVNDEEEENTTEKKLSNLENSLQEDISYLENELNEFSDENKKKKKASRQKRVKAEPLVKVEKEATSDSLEGYVLKNEDDGTYSCKFCGRASQFRHVIANHVELHIEGLSYPCTFPECDKISKTRNAQRTHISTFHNKKMKRAQAWQDVTV